MSVEVALLEERLHDAEARLEKACDEIIELRAAHDATKAERKRLQVHNHLLRRECDAVAPAVDALEHMNDELAVLHNFWKSAAERALRLWEAEADKNTAILDVVDSVVCHPSTSMTHDLWNALEAVLEEE